jgi:hypothetical protein
MAPTWEDEPRYVPVLVREDLREKAERELAWMETEADAASEE